MKLIVGLGNPGRTYAATRHNIGFAVARALVKKHRGIFKKDARTCSLNSRIRMGPNEVIVAMPVTFMNLSGRAVVLLADKCKAGTGDILVVCDDMDLELGRIKIKPSGSSGGHRGLASIIETLGSRDFARLRIGIGRPFKGKGAPDYVLSCFNRTETGSVKKVIEEACACCETWIAQGADKSMNVFNRRNNEHEEI